MDWYKDIWKTFPDEVGMEMRNVDYYLKRSSNLRQNPFKVAISPQYKEFDAFQFMECFEDFPTHTVRIIVEFSHGLEQKLLG